MGRQDRRSRQFTSASLVRVRAQLGSSSTSSACSLLWSFALPVFLVQFVPNAYLDSVSTARGVLMFTVK